MLPETAVEWAPAIIALVVFGTVHLLYNSPYRAQSRRVVNLLAWLLFIGGLACFAVLVVFALDTETTRMITLLSAFSGLMLLFISWFESLISWRWHKFQGPFKGG